MTPCSHNRIEFVYRRDGIDYVHCLECNTVCDAEDLEAIPAYDDDEANGGSGPASGMTFEPFLSHKPGGVSRDC